MEKENRPYRVSVAVTLLWIVVVLTVIKDILTFQLSLKVANIYGLEGGMGMSWFFIIFFTYLFMAFFIYKIGQGRNWARLTFLVLFIIGVVYTGYNSIGSAMFYLSGAMGIIGVIFGAVVIIEIILQLIALVFLFQKSSSDWFKGKR
jgi:hypothetical protein